MQICIDMRKNNASGVVGSPRSVFVCFFVSLFLCLIASLLLVGRVYVVHEIVVKYDAVIYPITP